MGSFDHIPDAAPAASGGSFDHIPMAGPDEPQSGGAFAHKELAPGQAEEGERRRKLMQLVEAKGEPGYKERFIDNFTMGLNRPLGGVASAIGGGSWKAGVGAEEDYVKRAERNTNPYLGGLVDFAGGLVSAGPAASLGRGAATVVQQAPTRAAQVAKWLTGATGSGAIEGASRNAESVPNALLGGAVGGATGKVASGVVGALTDRFAGKAAREAVAEATERGGGSEAAKEAGGAIYKKLDDAGIKFRDTPTLVKNSIDRMGKEGFNPETHKELVPVLEQIGNLQKKSATWSELQGIRTQISDARASDDKRVRRMATHLGEVLDDFVEKAKPTVPQRSIGIAVGDEAKAARDLWRKGSQAENVEWLAEKGMYATKDKGRKLETNFGGEVDKVNNPRRFSTHQNNADQVDRLKDIAVGDPKRAKLAEIMNTQSNYLFGLGGAGVASGLGTAAALGDPIGVGSGLSGAGAVALALGAGTKGGASLVRKGIANRGQGRVDDLIRNIVKGDDKSSNVPREALAKILAAEQVKLGAGRYSSNFFEKDKPK